MSNYRSSIVSKYYDVDKVKEDSIILKEIISRQSPALLLDAIAEACGVTANKFNLSEDDRKRLIDSLVNEFKSALQERL